MANTLVSSRKICIYNKNQILNSTFLSKIANEIRIPQIQTFSIHFGQQYHFSNIIQMVLNHSVNDSYQV